MDIEKVLNELGIDGSRAHFILPVWSWGTRR
jgi:hypothetical protein